MKKILFFITLCITQFLTAQIELEHSFPNYVYINNVENIYSHIEAHRGYIEKDEINNRVTLYNTDYSVRKAINLTPPEGYTIDNSLFNFIDNNKVYIFVSYTNRENGELDSILKLHDEDGKEIFNFGNAAIISSFMSYLDKPILVVYKFDLENDTTATEIYSIPVSGILSLKDIENTKKVLPYPNPSTQLINLPYILTKAQSDLLKIYDMNGKLVNMKKVYNTAENLILNVSSLSPGLYIYKVGAFESKFIVK